MMLFLILGMTATASIHQKYPQYCWEFHDNSSERPHPELFLKIRGVLFLALRGREFLEMLWKPQMP